MLNRLETSEEIKIPPNLQGCLTVENPTFIEGRYFFTESELLEQIKKMYHAADQLQELQIPFVNTCLMQNMDQLPNHVLFLAATNRRDVLDEALLRRFLFKKEIKPFSKEQRIKLTESYFESISLPISKERILKLAEPEQTQAKLISQIIYTIATEKGELL